uniref:Uncharacterized protein n=1 Tax=Rhizophora mucronata TaxID=61149 RepID=A0A2P2N7D0_RHIMU
MCLHKENIYNDSINLV